MNQCNSCHRLISDSNPIEFSCTHKYCSSCLMHDLICQHINKLSFASDTITAKCKCNLGEYTLPFSSLENLKINKCSKDNICLIHNKKNCKNYCKKCKLLLCTECISSNTHNGHELIVIDDYLKELKKSIKSLKNKNFKSFNSSLEKYYDNFNVQINNMYDQDIKELDDLVEKINTIKAKLLEEKNKLIKREQIIYNLLKAYYSDSYSSLEQINTGKNKNFFLAKKLQKVKYEVNEILLTKNDTINQEINKIKNELTTIYENKNFDMKLIYPYFGLIKNFVPMKTIELVKGQIKSVAILNNTNQIATASSDNIIRIFSQDPAEIYKLSFELDKQNSRINSLITINNYLISGNKEGIINIYDSFNNFNLCQVIDDNMEEVLDMSVLKNEGGFITANEDKSIKIYTKAEEKALKNETSEPLPIAEPQAKPETNEIKAENTDKMDIDIDTEMKNFTNEPTLNENKNDQVNPQADLEDAATINNNTELIKNNPKIYIVSELLEGHEERVNCAVQFENLDIISGSDDYTVAVWRKNLLESNFYEIVQNIGGFIDGINSVCEFKGNIVCSSGMNIKIFFYDNDKKMYINNYTIKGNEELTHYRNISRVISLKDERFASCSYDKSTKIWSFNPIEENFRCDQTLTENEMAVTDIVESKEGKLISVSDDKKVVIFKRVKNI